MLKLIMINILVNCLCFIQYFVHLQFNVYFILFLFHLILTLFMLKDILLFPLILNIFHHINYCLMINIFHIIFNVLNVMNNISILE